MDKDYWDSCLFLSYLQNKPVERGFVDIIDARLRKAEAGETLIVIATLVLAEIRPLREHDAERAEVIWDLFHTNRPYIKIVALSPRIAELAATIGSQFTITTPDAIHLATAWSEKVNTFLTKDGARNNERRRSGGLLAFNGKIGNPPLRIELPTMPPNTQMPLPEDITVPQAIVPVEGTTRPTPTPPLPLAMSVRSSTQIRPPRPETTHRLIRKLLFLLRQRRDSGDVPVE